MNEDLARRSINSVKWNAISNIVQIVVGFTQSLILARLLPIRTFGVYAGALSIVTITAGLANFGMTGAFLYRCEETEDLERTASIHFTLQLILNMIWTAVMLVVGFVLIKPGGDGDLTAFLVLTLTHTIGNFSATPRAILWRQVEYRRIAIASITNIILTFIFTCILALYGQALWALLATNIVDAFVNIYFFYIWRPVWRPKLLWSTPTVKYFLGFGSKQVVARLLTDALDKADELWVRTYLGATPLGFYSKAYSFALYPGKVIATPISNVARGTYAEAAHDREELSETYNRTNSFMIRTGFLLVGLLALVAPEFIRITIGERWMPMLSTFRLMLPFTLFSPMKSTMGSVFSAIGKPGVIVRIKSIQLAVMSVFLFIFGNLFGIEGVALAVDLMMVLGITLILHRAKQYIDFSLKKLFSVPILALFLALVAGFGLDRWLLGGMSDIFSGLIKGSVFNLFYVGILFLFDRKEIDVVHSMLKKYLLKNLL